MQGTRVRALGREDREYPTCRGVTKSMRHNYWACALEPALRNKGGHHNEKPVHRSKEQPPLTSTREKLGCSNRETQCSQK